MILLYRSCLRLIGTLPPNGRDSISYLASRVALAYSLTTSVINWTMILFYTINRLTKNSSTIDDVCETIMVIGVNARYYLLILRRSDLAGLLEECRDIWKECDENGRRAVRRFERKIRALFLFFLGSVISVNLLYSASAVKMTLDARTTASLNDTPPRYLPYKWYVEDGANLWPGHEIIFAVQVMVVFSESLITSSVDSAGPLLIMIAAGYFQALRQQLLSITEDNDDEAANVASRLVAWVGLHQRILNLCSRIDGITRLLFFPQLLCTCYNVSLFGVKLIGSDPDRYKYLPLMLANIGQLFICEWAPDHLANESSAISTAVYSTYLTWKRGGLDEFVALIIARSQRPVQMTAAGFVHLSLENFRAMFTSAVSFFTVLRKFDV